MPVEDPNAPRLKQSVRFGERYVSSALNRKVAGVLKPGVYHGFVVTPGTGLQVRVDNNPDDYPYSVAVVERDVWSITVTMTDGGTVDIPGEGTWYIVIEAYYCETEPGYQRVVARPSVEKHHVVIAKVTVAEGQTTLSQDDISYEENTLFDAETQARFAQISQAISLLNDWKTICVTTTEDIAENGTYTLPDGLTYRTGLHLLSVSWNGLDCYEGMQFQEVVTEDLEQSDKIQFLFPVQKGSELKISIRGYCNVDEVGLIGNYTDLKSEVRQLQNAFNELADNVAYISAGDDTTTTP